MTYHERIEWFEAHGYRVDTLRRPRKPNESALVQLQRQLGGEPMVFTISRKGNYQLLPKARRHGHN